MTSKPATGRAPAVNHTSTTQNDEQKPFAFQKLPPELRNHVYQHAVIEEDVIDLSDINRKERSWGLRGAEEGRVTSRQIQRIVRQPPLTRVCVEIRKEALPMFYRRNIFLLDLEHARRFQAISTVKWLTAIGTHNRRMLDNVYLLHDGFHLSDVVEAFAKDKVALTKIRPEDRLAEYLSTDDDGGGSGSNIHDGVSEEAEMEADETLYLKLAFEKP